MKFCTIILNRNLPEVTNKLYANIKKNNETDIYVLEAGSDKNNLSKHVTWHEKSSSVIKNGLRFPRGMNYALHKLWKNNLFQKYDYFFLLTNDTEFKNYKFQKKFETILKKHPRIGILSPCSENWGEIQLLKKEKIKYFWFIHNNAILIKKEFIEGVMIKNKKSYLNFLYDGNNFRGYGTESELIAKAYINNWSAAITSEVIISENESYLLNQAKEIKTDSYDKNLKLYIQEGLKWMENKYGFKSKWSMQMYVKTFYDQFFNYNPDLLKYKI